MEARRVLRREDKSFHGVHGDNREIFSFRIETEFSLIFPFHPRAPRDLCVKCLFLLIRWGFLAASAALLAGCARAPETIVLSGPTMGTTYIVKAVAPERGVDSGTVRAAIDDVLARIDREMSGYRNDSAIARFNAARTTEWFAVPADLAAVVRIALDISARSGGAFDITAAPLISAWGFGPDAAAAPPDGAAIATLRERVGYAKLHVRSNAPALRKDVPELAVDLNGVAPGFAVDSLARRLRAMQIESFLIDIGGEVRARGRNAQGRPWRVAVERPLDAQPKPYAIVQLDDAAVSTSGEYRNYRVRDGRRSSHTIDPRTGAPVERPFGSVVVIGRATAYVDAWATALNVLGADDGLALAVRNGLAAMFIERRGEGFTHRMTPQFERYIASPPPE